MVSRLVGYTIGEPLLTFGCSSMVNPVRAYRGVRMSGIMYPAFMSFKSLEVRVLVLMRWDQLFHLTELAEVHASPVDAH
eukprot:SAG31_NODE_838_length_11617_cov_36.512936_7_plen_79_part_00